MSAPAPLWRQRPELFEAPARVLASGPEGVVLDAPIFYPRGGGQPGDTGVIEWAGGAARVADTLKGAGRDESLLILEPGAPVPAPGAEVMQRLDAERRLGHMRVHTALHLLSVVIPLPVTGGQIAADRGRLDFDMPEAPEDRDALEARLRELVAQDHPVTETWISDEELAANPGLVKTMSVRPPVGAGRVRLIRIGPAEAPIDLQPCGGTHVARTGLIGGVRLGKIEKKGRRNRRVHLHLEP
ncbi:alanyl-tRNA editing protein [Oceanicella actignis]|uniref:Misacylated tRNA(Ala) deacylase n=1 Tax=Oceanicella actignis TaxID=1189325 RepID=A0A1M7TIG2_9RHOB|nr:alanyl-tRNA editing protein [Oceanicella actignis]TYO88427.1 misacylated tRNA(Ala) deacylase [Oceanicella actignis]SET58173.1 Ala-tRNA(Pro) hydrolase [Oceanicella actignis]SHN70398.1 misacylated tRNA(Ala) deacylase [Oceanicella actignis]